MIPKTNSGFYINIRTEGGNKLYRNKDEVPTMVYFEPEEKENIKTWKDLKDVILYKMQKGELIYGKPMTDKELNQFCKILFKYFEALDQNK